MILKESLIGSRGWAAILYISTWFALLVSQPDSAAVLVSSGTMDSPHSELATFIGLFIASYVLTLITWIFLQTFSDLPPLVNFIRFFALVAFWPVGLIVFILTPSLYLFAIRRAWPRLVAWWMQDGQPKQPMIQS